MNNSVSTVTGKIKIKIVFLGNQSVGKSSIIDKYVNDKFDDTAHVSWLLDSLRSGSIFWLKIYYTRLKIIDCSSGTLLVRRGSNLWFLAIWGTLIVLCLFLMWVTSRLSTVFRTGFSFITRTKREMDLLFWLETKLIWRMQGRSLRRRENRRQKS